MCADIVPAFYRRRRSRIVALETLRKPRGGCINRLHFSFPPGNRKGRPWRVRPSVVQAVKIETASVGACPTRPSSHEILLLLLRVLPGVRRRERRRRVARQGLLAVAATVRLPSPWSYRGRSFAPNPPCLEMGVDADSDVAFANTTVGPCLRPHTQHCRASVVSCALRVGEPSACSRIAESDAPRLGL
jgi:hypothetical protein